MSSTSASSSSGESKGVRKGHMECYVVMYSPGPLRKPGSRVWHDGLLTFYTINKKLMLRDDRGHLVLECFYLEGTASDKPDPKAEEVALFAVREGGQKVPTFAVGRDYEIGDDGESFAVEIERIRFIHEKTLDMAAIRAAANLKRNSTEVDSPLEPHNYLRRSKDPFKNEKGEDLILKKPDIWGTPVSRSSTSTTTNSSTSTSTSASRANKKRNAPSSFSSVLTESHRGNRMSTATATDDDKNDKHENKKSRHRPLSSGDPFSIVSEGLTMTLKGGRVSGIRKSSARREPA